MLLARLGFSTSLRQVQPVTKEKRADLGPALLGRVREIFAPVAIAYAS